MNFSIRARATLYLSGLVSLLLLSFALILAGAVSANLERDFRLRLQRDVDLLTELFKEELRLKALNEFREEATELGVNLRVLDTRGQVLFQSRLWGQTIASTEVPAPPTELSEIWTTVTVNRMPHTVISRRVEIEPHPVFVLQMAQPQDTVVEAQRLLLHWSLGLIPLMLLISVAVGYFFSGKLLAPVHTLRRQADALNSTDLSARIPYPPTRDEVYFLTDTLNRTLGRIEEAFLKLKAFAADASHELRIPLTAMRGTLELALRRERSPEEYRQALSEALEEAEHLSRITSDLLALTRADAGEKALQRTCVRVKPFLEQWVDTFQKTHPRPQITLHPVADVEVCMDTDQMERVLLNILDNALKYAGLDSPVDIHTQSDKGFWQLRIQDRGPGIAPEHRERIFDRFYRADKSRSREKGGSGLGLAIVSAIVQAHGGSVNIHKTSSEGTTFEVILPLENSNLSLKPL